MPWVLKPFEYFEPETAEQTIGILSAWGTRAKLLAGGVDLVSRMRRRKIEPECVVSIQAITGLNYIQNDGGKGLRIGALATLRSAELSPRVRNDYIPLWEAVHQIASVQVKTMATMVGNLCVASPASDVAPALIALGAELKIAGPASERTVPVENFFVGTGQTILKPGEMVTELSVPSLPAGTVGAFLKLARTATDIAKINVAVTLRLKDNRCEEARIVLGAVAPTVIRARKAEASLKGADLDTGVIRAAAELAGGEVKPITDVRSTAEYRKEMVKVLVKRAIEKALARSNGQDKTEN